MNLKTKTRHIILAIFLLFNSLPAMAQDQSSRKSDHSFNYVLTNYFDLFWFGASDIKASDKKFEMLFVGYHFTLFEFERLNLGGVGFGWGVSKDPLSPEGDLNLHSNLVITAPLSIRLTSKHSENLAHFNISYGYNLIGQGPLEGKHAVLLGFSLSYR